MSCKVICYRCMNFLCLAFNVSLLTFRWNVWIDHCSSSYICLASVWTLEQSNWSLISRTMLCRASKPLKLVAIQIQQMSREARFRCSMFSQLSQTFQMAPSLTSYSRPSARLLSTFRLLNFVMNSHRWSLLSSLPQVSFVSHSEFAITSHRWAAVKRLPQVSFVSHCDSSNKRV